MVLAARRSGAIAEVRALQAQGAIDEPRELVGVSRVGRVAGLLEKLRIEQTKSRPRRSNDNGLAEAKNGAVIRKHMGYGHIASAHAESINTFY